MKNCFDFPSFPNNIYICNLAFRIMRIKKHLQGFHGEQINSQKLLKIFFINTENPLRSTQTNRQTDTLDPTKTKIQIGKCQ